MPLAAALRLSTYLTAALATACLCFAEWPYLLEIAYLVGPVAILFVLAYRVEDQWRLSARAANGLGLIIAIGWVGWIVYSFAQADDSSGTSPWLVKLLPYIGPMLMVLLLVKLYRPKRVGDYWYIQGIGLIEVALACVLAGEPLFAVLFVGYLVSALWFLMIFYIYREQGKVSSEQWAVSSEVKDGHGLQETPGSSSSLPTALPWPFLGTFHAGRWAATILLVGFPLFLFIPQHGDADSIADIISGRAPAQTGFFPSEMDLNRIGIIEIDDKLAFEVFAENADGTPKLDLSPAQRWRGVVMDRYNARGRWVLDSQVMFSFQPIPQRELPDLGPDQYFLTYYVDTRLSHGLILADPLVLSGSPRLPYISLTYEGKPMEAMALFQELPGTLFPASLPGPAKVTYRQVCLTAGGDGLGPDLTLPPDPFRRNKSSAIPMSEKNVPQQLFRQPVKGIRQWTTELLRQLVAEGKLSREDIQSTALSPDISVLPLEKRAKVARALSDYLTYSGEYSYSLNLRREDFSLDPAEDFLRNVKQGHCERFATGLALMLRSAGVPCRLVKGFRGAETRDGTSLGDGWYVVRHSHAHAWVEALVAGPDKKLHWLTLDPSPVGSDEEGRTFSLSLWEQVSWLWLRNLWRTFVLEYNADQQRDTAQKLWNRLGPFRRFGAAQGPFCLAGGSALFLGFMWFRRVKTRRKRSLLRLPAELAFYGRLQTVLARYGRITRQPDQTPQEFGEAARKLLQTVPERAAVAEVPVQVVSLLYRTRYGRLPLAPAERQGIDLEIDKLAAVLKTIG